MENEVSNFMDTVRNLDPEDVARMLYWLEDNFNLTGAGYAANALNMYVT